MAALFGGLVREIRRSLGGITQEHLARTLGVGTTTVQNWEQDLKRPAPKYFRKMAELAPSFASEIAKIVESYEWHHHGKQERENPEMDLLKLVPTSLRASLRSLAKKTNLDISLLLRHALDLGITSLASTSSRDLEDLAKRHAEINREAHEQLTNSNQKKSRRNRVA